MSRAEKRRAKAESARTAKAVAAFAWAVGSVAQLNAHVFEGRRIDTGRFSFTVNENVGGLQGLSTITHLSPERWPVRISTNSLGGYLPVIQTPVNETEPGSTLGPLMPATEMLEHFLYGDEFRPSEDQVIERIRSEPEAFRDILEDDKISSELRANCARLLFSLYPETRVPPVLPPIVRMGVVLGLGEALSSGVLADTAMVGEFAEDPDQRVSSAAERILAG